MNKKTEAVRLASGKILKRGQKLRLANKIVDMFPRLRGQMLPTRDFGFWNDKAYDFKFVELLPSRDHDEKIKVHKMMSLVEDEVEFFATEEGVWYCYTTFFKIEIEQALGSGEVVAIKESRVPAIDPDGVKQLIEDINESFYYYFLGIITDNERENRVADYQIRFFRWYGGWNVKGSAWSCLKEMPYMGEF